jgi:hypothetical protein
MTAAIVTFGAAAGWGWTHRRLHRRHQIDPVCLAVITKRWALFAWAAALVAAATVAETVWRRTESIGTAPAFIFAAAAAIGASQVISMLVGLSRLANQVQQRDAWFVTAAVERDEDGQQLWVPYAAIGAFYGRVDEPAGRAAPTTSGSVAERAVERQVLVSGDVAAGGWVRVHDQGHWRVVGPLEEGGLGSLDETGGR